MEPPSPLPPNKARQDLENILLSLVIPANYRVVLDVDRDTENLHLTVYKITPWELKFFGLCFWRSTPNWESPHAIQRRLVSRTYAGLLLQLREAPEFLEFEIVSEGSVRYREAAVIPF